MDVIQIVIAMRRDALVLAVVSRPWEGAPVGVARGGSDMIRDRLGLATQRGDRPWAARDNQRYKFDSRFYVGIRLNCIALASAISVLNILLLTVAVTWT